MSDDLEELVARHLDDLTVIEAICETGDKNAIERIYRFVAQRKAALRAHQERKEGK